MTLIAKLDTEGVSNTAGSQDSWWLQPRGNKPLEVVATEGSQNSSSPTTNPTFYARTGSSTAEEYLNALNGAERGPTTPVAPTNNPNETVEDEVILHPLHTHPAEHVAFFINGVYERANMAGREAPLAEDINAYFIVDLFGKGGPGEFEEAERQNSYPGRLREAIDKLAESGDEQAIQALRIINQAYSNGEAQEIPTATTGSTPDTTEVSSVLPTTVEGAAPTEHATLDGKKLDPVITAQTQEQKISPPQSVEEDFTRHCNIKLDKKSAQTFGRTHYNQETVIVPGEEKPQPLGDYALKLIELSPRKREAAMNMLSGQDRVRATDALRLMEKGFFPANDPAVLMSYLRYQTYGSYEVKLKDLSDALSKLDPNEQYVFDMPTKSPAEFTIHKTGGFLGIGSSKVVATVPATIAPRADR